MQASSSGEENKNHIGSVGDSEAVEPQLGVSNTDDAAVIFQDDFNEDAGSSSDLEIISDRISVYSLDTDSDVSSEHEMIEEEYSADESQDEWQEQSVIKDLKKMRKLLHGKRLRSDSDGSSSGDDETNFLKEKLAELVEQLVSFRKKNKVKSSSNLDKKGSSLVQPEEFQQKLDKNPQNEKKSDDRDKVNQQMDWLDSASSSNLKLSSTQTAKSHVKNETIKVKNKMEKSQKEKDDRHHTDFPKPIPMKFKDSKNKKDDRHHTDFPKPIPMKFKDSKNKKDDSHHTDFPKPIPMKFKDSKNKKDDRHHTDFPKPIPMKFKDSENKKGGRHHTDFSKPIPMKFKDNENKKDGRHHTDFSKPIPMKFKDSENEKGNRHHTDFPKPIPVKLEDIKDAKKNRQSGLDGGSSSRMPAEFEQGRNNTRKDKTSGNEARNKSYNYDQKKKIRQKILRGNFSSILDKRLRLMKAQSAEIEVKRRKIDAIIKELQADWDGSSSSTDGGIFSRKENSGNERNRFNNYNREKEMKRQTRFGSSTITSSLPIELLRSKISENYRKTEAIIKEREKRCLIDEAPELRRLRPHTNKATFVESEHFKLQNDELQSLEIASILDERIKLLEAQLSENNRKLDAIRKQTEEREKVDEAPASAPETQNIPLSSVLTFEGSLRFKPQIDEPRSLKNQPSCSSSRRPKSEDVKACYYCHKVGHFARVCKLRIRNIRPVSRRRPY